MATINFLYRSTKEEAPLNIRLLYRTNTGKDMVLGGRTKLKVSKDYWVNKHFKKRTNDIDIINKRVEVNQELAKIESFVLGRFNEAQPEEINKQWLNRSVELYYNPTPEEKPLPTNLIPYIEYYLEAKKNEHSKASVKKINVIKHKLERYEETTQKQITIKEVNPEFANELKTYLIEQGYANNTVARDIRYIKTFCNHARKNGIEISLKIEDIKAKYQPTKGTYLTLEDIALIETPSAEVELSDSLENVRKWFLISYYTGQRISEFMRFSMDMVRIENNVPLLEFKQHKTGKLMTLPLSKRTLEILKSNPHPISHTKYNKRIKELAKEVGITYDIEGSLKVETEEGSGVYRKVFGVYPKYKLVSSHIGRRSFGTNNYGKIPTSFLKYVTGHATESMFLEYIGKSNKDIALELYKYMM